MSHEPSRFMDEVRGKRLIQALVSSHLVTAFHFHFSLHLPFSISISLISFSSLFSLLTLTPFLLARLVVGGHYCAHHSLSSFPAQLLWLGLGLNVGMGSQPLFSSKYSFIPPLSTFSFAQLLSFSSLLLFSLFIFPVTFLLFFHLISLCTLHCFTPLIFSLYRVLPASLALILLKTLVVILWM